MEYLDMEKRASVFVRAAAQNDGKVMPMLATANPIAPDACQWFVKVQFNHSCSFPSIPARLIGS